MVAGATGSHARLATTIQRWLASLSTLHRIAARLRCTGCNSLGDVPEVRVSAVRARSGGRDADAGAHCPMFEAHSRSHAIVQTTHPRRSRRKGSSEWAKQLRQPKPLTGDAAKNALMPRARELTRTGRYQRWIDVVLQFGEEEQDTMRAWLSDADKDELGTLSASARRFAIGRPPCCPAGGFDGHGRHV